MTQPETGNNEDVRRATEEVSHRLEELGIWLSGNEKSEDLVRILEGVESFEVAVQTRGGDLMVDEGPDGRTIQPDNIHFALPQRHADETVERFLDRLERAREEVLRQPVRE
jgi:hypothetical protein